MRDNYLNLARAYMAQDKSVVISVRLPKEVAKWYSDRGGSAAIKTVLYAHLLAQSGELWEGIKGRLIRSIVEECLSADADNNSEEDNDLQASMRFE